MVTISCRAAATKAGMRGIPLRDQARRMKRRTNSSPLRTRSEYTLIFPESPPTPWQIERRLAREVLERGEAVPRSRAINHYLRAVASAEEQFVVTDPDVADYLAELSVELAQESGTPPRLMTRDIDGQLRPLDRVRGRTILLERWDAWAGPQCLTTPHLAPYLKAARERLFDGITHNQTVVLDDWPVQEEGGHAALCSMNRQVIERAMSDMDWMDIAKEEVGLLVSLPPEPRGSRAAPASSARHQPHQPAIAVVGQDIEQTVRPLAHVADAGVDLGQQPLLANETSVVEHQPRQVAELQ